MVARLRDPVDSMGNPLKLSGNDVEEGHRNVYKRKLLFSTLNSCSSTNTVYLALECEVCIGGWQCQI